MAAQKGIELEVFFVFLFFYSSHPLSAPLVLCNTAFYSSISLTFSLLFSVGYVVSISLIYSAVSAFSTLVLSHVSSLRYSQKSWTLCSRFFLLPLAHISFLFTSSALLCFFLSPTCRFSQEKSLYMPKKYLDTSNMRLKHLSEGRLALPYF